MDIVSDVLRNVRMSGAFFFSAMNYAPWVCGEPRCSEIRARVMPDHQFVIPFHVILSGKCWIENVGPEPSVQRFEAGDIAVFPKGDPHFMMSDQGMRLQIDPAFFDPPPGRKQRLRYVVNGDHGRPVDCRFVCGFVGCDVRPFNPLLDSLPRMFRARASDANRDWLASMAEFAVAESERDAPGGETMLAKLADLMFAEVVRQHIDDPAQTARGWISGLRDSHVGAALHLLHDRPTETWTLESLARAVGMSRTVFAERFAQLVGMPAITYLVRWRLTLAARLLEDPSVSVAQAGADVGYESESAFQRAFKKFVGETPAVWRKGAGALPVTAQSRPELAE
ncbi:MAG: AraC family transcriptional regulator [Pseudorhodobacter sp.]|nr:AraC family transcriptional regulator [Pseudorhodobacter sp.]